MLVERDVRKGIDGWLVVDIDYSYGHIMATTITKVYGHNMYLVQIHYGCSSQQFYGFIFSRNTSGKN
jgi:hypothetical protein